MKKFLLCIITLVLSLGCFSGCKPVPGEAYTIKEAYEAGMITREDLMELLYQRDGKVYTCDDPKTPEDEWTELDYTSTKTFPELDKKTEKRIVYTYYKKFEEYFFDHIDGERLGGVENLTFSYLGEFNGLYAGTMQNTVWDYTMETFHVYLDGFIWVDFHSDFYLYKL